MSKKEDKRRITYANGDVYEGELDEKERPHGSGTYTHHDKNDKKQQGIYKGGWDHGEKNGQGTHHYRKGDVYEGRWEEGKRQGYGIYTYYTKPAEYKGDWKKNNKHGHGVMVFENDDTYDGQWVDGNMHDKEATYTWKDGSKYVGKCSAHFHFFKYVERQYLKLKKSDGYEAFDII
jgi:1-phosphatidylinositol-4-phosphate 5-kinase